MKRTLLFSPLVFIISSVVSAQAYEGKIEYDKKKQAAIVIEYSYSPDAAEGAFIQKMEKLGYRTKEQKGLFNSDKGFRNYKSAIIGDISSSSMDYIVKIERKSRKDKDESVLYLIIMKNGANLISTPDADVVSNAKSFLNKLEPEVEAFNLELQINDQQEVITKAEKKLKNLQEDQQSMEKKIKNLQDDMKKNAKEQQDTQKDIDNQTKALDILKGKRKSN